jgi:hypothetical protein
MNRKLFFAILILTLTVSACGGGESPTDTPVPPTKTPVPPTKTPVPPTDTPVPPTDTPVPPTETPEPTLELEAEAFRSDMGGYALRYPTGWQILGFAGMTVVYVSEEALEADLPTEPVILIEGAPLADLSEGEMADAQSAEEMIEAIVTLQAEEGDEWEMSEVQEITVSGGTGAFADITWVEEGVSVSGRFLTFHMGDQGVLVIGAGITEKWEPFLPTFEAMMASLSLFEPTEEPMIEVPEVEPISQWASFATASSQYSDPGWAASQATGAPDTAECGDSTTAWASSSSNTVEWLELGYDVPVYPTELNIIQTYSPDQVVLVELIDMDGNYHEVYSGEPAETDCPYTLSIPLDADYETIGVKITLDQTVFMNWNEIDAVELIGVPSGETVAVPPPSAGVTLQPPAPLPPVDAPMVELESGMYNYTNGNYVREIALYDGVLWAATSGGVVAWDLATGDAVKYTVLDGLPTNDVEAVAACPIPEMRIIFATEYGLVLFDPAADTLEPMNKDNSGMQRNDPDTLDCDPETNTLLVGYDPFGLDVFDANRGEWTF